MRKLVAITQLSVDGVMQAPGGPEEDPSGKFDRGGWAMPFVDEAARKVIDATIAGEFDMLLGRRTYEIFAGYWPKHGDDPIGAAFNKATKYVATRTLKRLAWKESKALGDAVKDVRKLKAGKGPEIHVWGSANLLQSLIAAGLVDEHRLWVFPVVLGRGKRLFENGAPPRTLKLVSTASTPTGVLLNSYRPAGPLPRG